MTEVKGLIVAIPTPFDSESAIDFDYVAKHLDFIGKRGANGAVPCGTNGEGSSMTMQERKEMFRVAVENKGDLAVVAGTGCPSLQETIELTKAAEKVGADAALVVPPYFFKNPSVDGLYNYYAAVLKSTDLPIFLYNIPSCSAIEIQDELVERLLEFPNLIGVKDSAGDAERTLRYIKKFPGLRIFYGADRIIEAMAGSGIYGSVSGVANAFPELISEAMKMCEMGQGSEMQARVTRLTYIYDKYPLFAANKTTLKLRGFPYTHVRPPLVDLTPEQEKALAEELRGEDLI